MEILKDDYLTPEWVLEPIRKACGGKIDLDPFYNPHSLVKAEKHYTELDDGYAQDWHFNVFANPPYSRGNLPKATAKAKAEYRKYDNVPIQIFMLIPAYTSTDYFQKDIFGSANAILFYNKRISFLNLDHTETDSPTFHSILAYWGGKAYFLDDYFKKQGTIIYPNSRPWL